MPPVTCGISTGKTRAGPNARSGGRSRRSELDMRARDTTEHGVFSPGRSRLRGVSAWAVLRDDVSPPGANAGLFVLLNRVRCVICATRASSVTPSLCHHIPPLQLTHFPAARRCCFGRHTPRRRSAPSRLSSQPRGSRSVMYRVFTPRYAHVPSVNAPHRPNSRRSFAAPPCQLNPPSSPPRSTRKSSASPPRQSLRTPVASASALV